MAIYRPANLSRLSGAVNYKGNSWVGLIESLLLRAGLRSPDWPARHAPIRSLTFGRFCSETSAMYRKAMMRAVGFDCAWILLLSASWTSWRERSEKIPTRFQRALLDPVKSPATEFENLTKSPLDYASHALRAVLDAAAQKADWGRPLRPNRGRGIAALCKPRHSIQSSTEVTLDGKGWFSVDRVVVAGDTGFARKPGHCRSPGRRLRGVWPYLDALWRNHNR